jgi:hypothetical protein
MNNVCSGKKETLHGPPEGGIRLMGTAVEHDGTRVGNLGVGNRGVGTRGVGNVESEMLGAGGTVRRMARASSTQRRKAK